MVDRIDTDLLNDGDDVTVDGNSGSIEIHNTKMIESVSSVIFVKGKMLMLKRPDDASSFPGMWSLAAGRVEKGERTEDAAGREIYEETGIQVSSPHASLDPILVREKDVIWKVYPFLFIHDSYDVTLNGENRGYEWIVPEEIEKKNTVTSTVKAVRELISKIKGQ
jgi:8-oxo-dGTP pyrophosphatase MutT (NUDIX family)